MITLLPGITPLSIKILMIMPLLTSSIRSLRGFQKRRKRQRSLNRPTIRSSESKLSSRPRLLRRLRLNKDSSRLKKRKPERSSRRELSSFGSSNKTLETSRCQFLMRTLKKRNCQKFNPKMTKNLWMLKSSSLEIVKFKFNLKNQEFST